MLHKSGYNVSTLPIERILFKPANALDPLACITLLLPAVAHIPVLRTDLVSAEHVENLRPQLSDLLVRHSGWYEQCISLLDLQFDFSWVLYTSESQESGPAENDDGFVACSMEVIGRIHGVRPLWLDDIHLREVVFDCVLPSALPEKRFIVDQRLIVRVGVGVTTMPRW